VGVKVESDPGFPGSPGRRSQIRKLVGKPVILEKFST
jgi:hypothetical protein